MEKKNIDDKFIGLKIKDAIIFNENLKKYVEVKINKSGKEIYKIDFNSKEAVYEYNVAILKGLYGLNMKFHSDALVPTPVNRYTFIYYIISEFLNNLDTLDKSEDKPELNILEIGTGSGILSILMSKYFCELTNKCDKDNKDIELINMYATDIKEEYLEIARENYSNNLDKLKLPIKFVNSQGNLIKNISELNKELNNNKYDIIFTYPPYYSDHSVASIRSFGGADAEKVELIGGGKYGEKFSEKLIEEAKDVLNENGIIAFMFPDKPEERRTLVENKILDCNLKLEKYEIQSGKRKRHIIFGIKK
ncbi:methylase of polypeptide subunit release factors [Methanococcus voltae]|uniref:RlmF-related methyltransferase n=1 Tax=Methanococcus voltae TaxID=2188 RepID=UPI001AE889AB|nr:RlmF-related methyltransferase [Methanococcus voltae]MBP2144395.1 methylase of polypeptide subunit release factors [Methanococcus voltae]